jgi:anti-sigma28 factor (negative regulator of flagellin synthesis)
MVNFKEAKMSKKVIAIKKAIKNGTYDWKKAIEGAAKKISEHPEALLWR